MVPEIADTCDWVSAVISARGWSTGSFMVPVMALQPPAGDPLCADALLLQLPPTTQLDAESQLGP